MPVEDIRLIVKSGLYPQVRRRGLLALAGDGRVDPEQRLVFIHRGHDVFEFVALFPGVVGSFRDRVSIIGQRKFAEAPVRHEGRIIEGELNEEDLGGFRILEEISVRASLDDPATTNVERRIEMNEIPRVMRLQG